MRKRKPDLDDIIYLIKEEVLEDVPISSVKAGKWKDGKSSRI